MSQLAIVLRDAAETDIPVITAIYAHHVIYGLGTFEQVAPSAEEMARRRADVLALGLPYLVAADDSGLVRGYAYAALYRLRSGYRFTVEDSIYVAPDSLRRGIGRALLGALIERCIRTQYRQMVAVIGDSANFASITLHDRLGFKRIGVQPAIGFKHGRWVDSVLMQRALGPGHLDAAFGRGDAMSAAALSDVIEQDWDAYTPEQHAVWRTLFRRQEAILAQRACDEFLGGLAGPGITADGIPEFRRLNEVLRAATGWTVVAVPGLVPDAVFFEHLASRRFPATCFIRGAGQLDYLEEPDVFHDIFGHVPMLMNPVFADYMQAYGASGLKALKLGGLHHLARLYWYTVEFGLIRTANGARIYGSGIVSSRGESMYCLESAVPKRLGFDLLRVMRTRYRIDDFQPIYFVIASFEQLFAATRPDFTPYYAALAALPDLEPETVLPEDRVIAP